MRLDKVFAIKFSSVYPLYVKKAESKGRSSEEVDEVICWLTGHDPAGLDRVLSEGHDLQRFFDEAPQLNPVRDQVTGVICGVRIEAIDEPLMREIRILDKLVDELARGRPMAKVLRQA